MKYSILFHAADEVKKEFENYVGKPYYYGILYKLREFSIEGKPGMAFVVIGSRLSYIRAKIKLKGVCTVLPF